MHTGNPIGAVLAGAAAGLQAVTMEGQTVTAYSYLIKSRDLGNRWTKGQPPTSKLPAHPPQSQRRVNNVLPPTNQATHETYASISRKHGLA